jgi:hypothetical protein
MMPARHHNRRRNLDPTRYLQSRELWNNVRLFHEESTSSANAAAGKKGKLLYYKALCQAILYEIQPIKFKPAYHRLIAFVTRKDDEGLQHALHATLRCAIHILKSIIQFMRRYCTISSFQKHKMTIAQSILAIIALKLYHIAILYLHESIHAGPILIIVTLLILIYTIGLADNSGSGGPSAYSVFNRGMFRILGTIDAEDLVRQYAGGAAAAMEGGGGRRRDRHDNDDEVWMMNAEEVREGENDDEIIVRNERRRRRRLERLQQQQRWRNNNNDNLVDGHRRGVNVDGQDHNDTDDNVNGQRNDNAPTSQADANNSAAAAVGEAGGDTAADTAGAARKSGKKARRRNLELRREIQRQRQAAAANGFGRGDGDDDVAMDQFMD